MIKIRLSRTGRKNKHSYRIVIASSKSPRDGKFIEKIGFFNIFNKEVIRLNIKKFLFWKNNGAKVSNRINFLIKKYNLLRNE